MAPSQTCGFKESIHHAAQANGYGQSPPPIDRGGAGSAGFRNMPQRNCGYHGRQRKVNEEYPVPGRVLDEQSAEHWTERGGDGGKDGPGPDGLTPGFLVETGADNRQAAG